MITFQPALPRVSQYNNSQSVAFNGQNKRSTSNKVIIYTTAAAMTLGATGCGDNKNFKELENVDVYEQINRRELLNSFSLDYLKEVEQISKNEYCAHIGFDMMRQVGLAGDLQGEVYLKKDEKNPNHISGSLNLFRVKSHLAHYEVPSKYGTKTVHERVYQTTPYKDLKFDAKLKKDKNSDNYKIYLKVLDENNKRSEHVIEKNEEGVLLDGKTPFEFAHDMDKSRRNAWLLLLGGIIFTFGTTHYVSRCEEKCRHED